MKSNFEKVKEFSNPVLVAQGRELPQFASPMEYIEVVHCVKMVIDEMVELLATVSHPEERELIISCIVDGLDYRFDLEKPNSNSEEIRQQVDAITDAKYYLDDCAARKSFPIDEFFDSVNNANLRKIVNGKVILKGEKVQKPEGWISPDKEQEEIIARAMGISV